MAYNRRRTRSQNDRSGILRQQDKWLGENRDQDPTTLTEGEVALLENAISFEKHVEERPGSWVHSTNPDLVGTCYGKFFHKASKRWIFHIDDKLLWSDFSCAVLTEILDYSGSSIGISEDGSNNPPAIMKDFLDGVLATRAHFSDPGLIFINILEDVPKFYNINASCPNGRWVPIAASAAAKTRRYRYLYTFSRMDDGVIVHESGTMVLSDVDQVDYLEVVLEEAISDTNPVNIDTAEEGTADRPDEYALGSSPHWTHITIYRTLDIGTDYGFDGKTGEKNDPNLFIWHSNFLLEASPAPTIFEDGISDEVLRGGISSTDGASAYILKVRGFAPMVGFPSFFAISPNFILVSQTFFKTQINYCQLDTPRNAGYHNPLQNKKFSQDVNAIQIYQNTAVFCHTSSMSGGDLNAYQDRGLAGSPMFTLESFYPLDQVNGVTDYATIAETENGKFLAVCSDKSVRLFGGVRFGEDLCQDTISREVMKKAVTFGAVAKVFNGAYLLWFSDSLSSEKNELCIRLAIQKTAGRGWCEYWDFIETNRFHAGEVAVDDNGLHRLIVQEQESGFLYEIETYDGPPGSEVFRSVRDKCVQGLATQSSGNAIVSRVKLPDYTGELQSFLCRHQVTNAYTRVRNPVSGSNIYAQDSDGFAAGFSLEVNGYADGLLVDTITGAPVSGDLEFHNPIAGSRLGIEFIMNAGGWRLVRCDTRFRVIDKKKTEGINETNEAGYLAELEADRVLWVSRGKRLDLERCLGRRYWLLDPEDGEFAPATGPDGVDGSAIAFTSDAGSAFFGASAAGVSWLPETVLIGEFTISFWYKAGVGGFTPGDILNGADTDALRISLADATTMHLENFSEDITIASVSDGEWHHFLIREVDEIISVFQNGTLRGSFADIAPSPTINGSETYIGGPSIQLFDLCVYNAAKSDAAMAFYREDVSNNDGKKALPYF